MGKQGNLLKPFIVVPSFRMFVGVWYNQFLLYSLCQVAVNTTIQNEREFLDHIIKSTNMKCLTAP